MPRILALAFIAIPLLLSACGGGGSDAANSSTSGSSPSGSTSSSTASSTPTVKLSGTPIQSVIAGADYAFQPTVSTTGGTVTFSITGLPAWATFNSSTGELSGTPSSADVGTTGAITITATDGGGTASLGPFTVQIDPASGASAGSATLSWDPPTENTNGTPITDLAGYYIVYGSSPAAMTQKVTVPSPATNEYEISNLSPGTYYFEVIAYTSSGVEGTPSQVASMTI
jgi:hypothetical protein